MSSTERCRSALKMLEVKLREEVNQTPGSAAPHFVFSDVLLSNGRVTYSLVVYSFLCQKPNPLVEVELLDLITSYMTLKCEDDVRFRMFCELFPHDGQMHEYQLEFMVKLSSLACSLGLPLLLDLVAVWLKIQVARLFGWSVPSLPAPNPSISHRLLTRFVTSVTPDLLNMQEVSSKTHDSDSVSVALLPHVSPVFADAYLSAVALTSGFEPSLVSSFPFEPPIKLVGTLPPLALLNTITQWIQLSRLQQHKSHHSFSLTSVDWTAVFRRHTSGLFPHSAVEQLLSHVPSMPVLLIWWTVLGPIVSTQKLSEPSDKTKMFGALADLHREVLQCLSEVHSGQSSDGHRSGSSSSSSWFITCLRKSDHTKDLECLTQLVQCVAKVYSNSLSTAVDDKELMIIRLAEFFQVAWSTGRLRGLTNDEFAQLIAPLGNHKLFELIKSGLRR